MLALLLVPAIASAADVTGFAEVRGSTYANVDGVPWQLVERVRPEFSVELSDRVLVASTVEAALVQGRNLSDELQRALEAGEFASLLEAGGCEWPAPGGNAYLNVGDADDYLDVDRLYVDVYQPGFDVRVGRQALQWGSALLINPTDPFPEVLFVEPWRPRAGVNAARLTVPFGLSQVQAVAGVDDELVNPRLAARGTLNALQTDFSLVGAYRQVGPPGEPDGSGLVGVDIKGTLGVGFWLEGAVHLDEDAWEELAVGFDYSFPVADLFNVSAQYYRNGGGATDPDDYDVVNRTSASVQPPECAADEVSAIFAAGEPDPFAPFVVGTDYGLLQALIRQGDITVSATVLQNLRDTSGVAVPFVSWRPGAVWEVALTAQVPYRIAGRTGEFKPADPELVLRVPSPLGGTLDADLSGLVPDATVVLWTRAYFQGKR